MKVKNINGTSDNKCHCESWLDHWKNFSQVHNPKYCVEKTCIKAPKHGAHVQKDQLGDSNWYIVPLCVTHNLRKGEEIEISDNTILVRANVSLTCGRTNA